MKARVLLVFTMLMVWTLFLIWCKKSQEVTTCTLNLSPEDWTNVESIYKITHNWKYVDLVETIETVKSNNKEVLDYYKSIVESSYEPFKNLEYYDYKVETTNDTLVSETTINYSKIDIDKFIKINPASSNFINNGKVSLDSLKTIYGLIGAKCE